MGRKFGLICFSVFFLFQFRTAKAADDLQRQADALKLIRETAADICSTIQHEGSDQNVELSGNAKAKLSGALSKIADLGIEGAAKFKKDEFKGVLQTELAAVIRDNANCRLEVLKLLNEKLLPASTSPQLNQKMNYKICMGNGGGTNCMSGADAYFGMDQNS